jgi:hypothetical protein
MALSKAQKAAKAQKRIDEARALLATAEAEGAEHGIASTAIGAPAIGGETKKNTSTVWIGCKLPRGLNLRLCKEVTVDRPTFGGGVKPTKMYMPDPLRGEVRLFGYAIPFGKIPKFSIIGDFGLTEVDRDWWNEWKSQNSGFDMLKNGLIFEHGEKASVEAYAQEHADLKCGLEPMDPAGDDRGERAPNDNLTDVEPDADRIKEVRRTQKIA